MPQSDKAGIKISSSSKITIKNSIPNKNKVNWIFEEGDKKKTDGALLI